MEPLNHFVTRYHRSVECLALVSFPTKAAIIADVLTVVIVTERETLLKPRFKRKRDEHFVQSERNSVSNHRLITERTVDIDETWLMQLRESQMGMSCPVMYHI